MIVLILLLISLSVTLIFGFEYKKEKKEYFKRHDYYYKDESLIWFIFMVALIVTCIIGFITLCATVTSFVDAKSNYDELIAEREGLEFSYNYLWDVYTDKFELNNSTLINDVKEFNVKLAKRQAYSHNIFSGLFISDYADNVAPIDYESLLANRFFTL